MLDEKGINKMFHQLFLETAHGDEEHRQWLLDKFEEFKRKYFSQIFGTDGVRR